MPHRRIRDQQPPVRAGPAYLTPPVLAALWLLAVNLAAFAAFGVDKRSARAGGRRVAEATLLRLALLGGTPGAYAGRRVFRHKTRKQPFSGRLFHIAVIQMLAIGGLIGWTLSR